MVLRDFFRSRVSVLSRRIRLFTVVNFMFFCCIVFGAFLGQAGYLPLYGWTGLGTHFSVEVGDLLVLMVAIFLFNLVLSGFIFVTLSGLAFFAVPVGVLGVRATLWGVLLNPLSTPHFLAVFPTLILEGEGYVLASVAGIDFGLSWLKPAWVYGGEGLSRVEALKKASKECLRVYVLVATLLLVAAITETATIVLLGESITDALESFV